MEVGILAGGKSSRYNKDKLTEQYNGKTFIEHLYDEMSKLGKVIISTKEGREYIKSVDYVYDINSDIGAIEGLYRLLINSKEDYMAIISGDTPLVSSEMIKYLEGYISSDYDVYVYKDKFGVHPLCAIYSKKVINDIEDAIVNKKYSIHKLLYSLRTKYIDIENSKFSSKLLLNINTQEDYNKIYGNVLAISGVKNSGKTTFIYKLLQNLNEYINDIVVIKHDGHSYDIDYKDTDTYKYRNAGAKDIAIISQDKTAIIHYKEKNILDILNYFSDKKLVILEGYKNSDFPKIEIVRKGISTEAVCTKNVIGIATDIDNFELDKTIFDLDDISKISDFIKKRYEL